MSTKPKKYAGELAEPIVRPEPLVVALIAHGATDEKKKQIYKEARGWVVSEQARKLLALAKHYGISVNSPNWRTRLLLALAAEHVPGFKVVDRPPKGPGAPRKDYYELFMAINKLCAEGKTIKGACQVLSKRRGEWYGKNPASLEARYHEWPKLMQRMKAEPSSDPLIRRLTALKDA